MHIWGATQVKTLTLCYGAGCSLVTPEEQLSCGHALTSSDRRTWLLLQAGALIPRGAGRSTLVAMRGLLHARPKARRILPAAARAPTSYHSRTRTGS